LKILITGGTGFIGSRLAMRCLERGDNVRIYGQENTEAEKMNAGHLRDKGAEVVIGSMTDRRMVSRAVEDIDIVFHLAAAQHEANISDQVFYEVNVSGTRKIIEASLKAGVKRFVHGSTIGVYGVVDGLIDETTSCRPDNIYGITKLEGEKLALSFQNQLPVTVIRIPEVYGPGDRRLLKLFKMIQRDRFIMIGKGKNLHHLIYIDDLIQSFFLAAEKEEAVGEVFLLAGERPVSTNVMVETIAQHLAAKAFLFRVPFAPLYLIAATMEFVLRPMGIQPPLHRRRMDFFKKSFELSWKKAADILGYHPEVGFSEGILETAKWYVTMGLIKDTNPDSLKVGEIEGIEDKSGREDEILSSKFELKAKIEPFDSFWEAPEDINSGYSKFGTFYKYNYLDHFPSNRTSNMLVISCGPGYMVNLLNQNGYSNVMGIDAMPQKIIPARMRGLNCEAARAFDILDVNINAYDVIFCEQEINHLTKEEILSFLGLCFKSLRPGGTLIFHSLNGANPFVGSENLALNFDHYNTFTEWSLVQILKHTGYGNIKILPLKLYVFYKNPVNYIGLTLDFLISQFFKFVFMFYGKKNKLFSKKIAAICQKNI
jgi:nucleoside-diphosphate-sugar epimerase/SAM-dependent methyltransferase